MRRPVGTDEKIDLVDSGHLLVKRHRRGRYALIVIIDELDRQLLAETSRYDAAGLVEVCSNASVILSHLPASVELTPVSDIVVPRRSGRRRNSARHLAVPPFRWQRQPAPIVYKILHSPSPPVRGRRPAIPCCPRLDGDTIGRHRAINPAMREIEHGVDQAGSEPAAWSASCAAARARARLYGL